MFKVSNSGFTISNVPKKPTTIAKTLFKPIGFLRITLERIVMKNGLMKNRLVASARLILLTAM